MHDTLKGLPATRQRPNLTLLGPTLRRLHTAARLLSFHPHLPCTPMIPRMEMSLETEVARSD